MKYIKDLNKSKNRYFEELKKENNLESNLDTILQRGTQDYSKTLEIVENIEKNILKSGDEYSKILTRKFD